MEAFKSYRTGSGQSISSLLAKYGSKAEASLGRQLFREASGILSASAGLVPVDTGALKSSGYVADPKREGDVIEVVLGYGGPAAQINPKTGESTDGYAVMVHENLEAHHPVGSAKFLEMPFDQATQGMATRVAAAMKGELSGGAAAPTESEA